MSLSNDAESNILLLLFNNTTIANYGDTTGIVGSSVAGSFYVGLSTGTLTDTSTQTSTEAAYTSYARVAVARSAGGWTISATSPTQAANTSAITFPACTGGSETETYFVVGRASGLVAGAVIYWGALTASLAVSNGITPSFSSSSCVLTLD